ncbi:LysR family transcriptional regulator ArgP [Salinibacterium sp. SYSU T00001]|uniref:LysR family transcriptional regulator ArgP n=1 Tax=Homoserinimonas sedimenticola TaxID=2986805 RepID=UPI0022355CB0|nr:LysR family transcriptional regulator ArgP [Salinibacterium sedimenticola]MCW4385251.1 LysR family transcriptional regulator ArgP [Salinibacterium sedimenticola]
MQIPLDLARTVTAVVDEGTLEGAARALHITPSAVSQRIKALEQRLGRVLLVRSKPVRATDAGAAIVRLARQMALLEHDALAEVGLDDEGERLTPVGIAVNADSLATWLLPALAEVAHEHPVVFELHREDEEFTTRLLESGQVMAAVTSQSTSVPGCVVTPLVTVRYRAVASQAFVERWMPEGVTAPALGRCPRIDFDRRDDMQAAFLRSIRVRTTPPIHYVPASTEYATAIRLGLGWGMLPDEQARGTGLIDLMPERPLDVPLYWQQWNLSSPLLTAISDAVARAARSLAPLVPPLPRGH